MEDVNLLNMQYHHVGYAVRDFTEAVQFFSELGYVKIAEVYDPEQNVNVCVLENGTFQKIELLSPFDENSPINDILKKSGPTPYHLCYEVRDMEEAIKVLRAEKFMVVAKPKVSNAFNGRKVCFLYNRNIGLIEIIES